MEDGDDPTSDGSETGPGLLSWHDDGTRKKRIEDKPWLERICDLLRSRRRWHTNISTSFRKLRTIVHTKRVTKWVDSSGLKWIHASKFRMEWIGAKP